MTSGALSCAHAPPPLPPPKQCQTLAHQNRTIAIASDVSADGAKPPEITQKEGVSTSEIVTQNRESPATFHRTLKSQCKVSEIASDFWGASFEIEKAYLAA